MHVFNSNEMFILALVAISIVGVMCLGLMIVLAIAILRQKSTMDQQNNQPSIKDVPLVDPPPSPPDGEQSQLTISDWVNYLTGEKFGIMGTVLNVSAVLVALVALIYSLSTNTMWDAISNGIIVVALAGYVLMKIFRPFERRGKLAESILSQVMSGELKSEESIRKAWIEGLKQKKYGRKKDTPTKKIE